MTDPVPIPVPVPVSESCDRSRQLARGYTVAELVVTLALTTLIMLVALQLIVEAVGLARRGDRRLDPIRIVTVMSSLRKDVHGAVAVGGLVDIGWQNGPLDLAGWDGSRVRYALEGDRVIRESRDSLGRAAGRRVVAAGVAAWWWRPLNFRTVEVRLTIAPQTSVGASIEGRHTQTRIFAVRGWPDGRSW